MNGTEEPRRGWDAYRREMAERRIVEAMEERRAALRGHVLSGLGMLTSIALGVFLLLWSAHTTSVSHGRIAWHLGYLIGNGGIVLAIVDLVRRESEV